MSDLISRVKLLEKLHYTKDDDSNNKAIWTICHEPEVDAKPVVHGEWIVTDCERSDNQSYGDYIEVECSCCGYGIGAESGQYDWYYGDEFTLNYCPECGADMRKENNNGNGK